ncbi:MAG: hypothetical protein M0Z83_03085 [Betaproteobacteria bacterium]|nr:hypothetical protein [Betaproteobacteria bacterium]
MNYSDKYESVSNEVTGLQAGGYLVRAGFGAPAGLKAGFLNQQGKRIKNVWKK